MDPVPTCGLHTTSTENNRGGSKFILHVNMGCREGAEKIFPYCIYISGFFFVVVIVVLNSLTLFYHLRKRVLFDFL